MPERLIYFTTRRYKSTLPYLHDHVTGPDFTMLLDLFIQYSSFYFNFFVCPVWWTNLAKRQLFIACTANTQYRIV